MRRTEHLGARTLTLVGLTATFVYLLWRTVFTLDGTEWWLSLPVLAVEMIGFVGACALAWALWPSPVVSHADARAADADEAIDVVVRVDRNPSNELRATLLALRGVRRVQRVVVVDLSARPEIAALANEFQAAYAASDVADHNGLRVMPAAVHSDRFLLLDAGDVPTGDILERLDAEMVDGAMVDGRMVDGQIAVVQGLGVSLAADSAEHGPSGRHELIFERSSLNPALGRRGNAVWSGTGSLVRTAALQELTVANEPVLEAHWLAGVALLANGWRVLAPGDVAVVAHRTVHSEDEVARDQLLRARAARRVVFGDGGALRSSALTPKQRLSLLAWAVRPLSGLRRVVFLVLLGASILSGSAPFHATLPMMAGTWLPAFVCTSLGVALLSGWTLRPGDRSRWSLHSMGAACRSLRSATAHPTGRAAIVALPSPQYGAGLVVAVVGLSTILVLRGVSDRVTHTLGTMSQGPLMALMLVTLWVLGISLDLLRVLARRTQLRGTTRVVSSLPATLGERTVNIVDLTALGAGMIGQTGVELNERLLLDTVIPTSSGVTTVRVMCIVRNIALQVDGDYRIGIEFGDADSATANALAEFCTIDPAWEQLGSVAVSAVSSGRRMLAVDEPQPERASGRAAIRFVSLLALVGVVASAIPSTADASPTLEHHLSGAVIAFAASVDAPPSTDDTVTGDTVTGDTVVPDTAAETTNDTVVDTAAPGTAVDTTLESNLFPSTTLAGEFATGAPMPVPGAMVVAVCSLEQGADGRWGTADDVYSAPVATTTDAAGNYELELIGTACWASVSPPEQFDDPSAVAGGPQVIDVSAANATHEPVVFRRVAPAELSPAAGFPSGSIGDTVWSDDDRDGFQDPDEPGVIGVSLALLDEAGHRVDGTHSDSAGEFHFDGVAPGSYRVSVANLPAGLGFTTARAGSDPSADSDTDPVTGRTGLVALAAGQRAAGLDVGLAPAGQIASAPPAASQSVTGERVLPAPAADQVAAVSHQTSRLSIVVVAFAALLALSILLGLVRPRPVRAG